MYSLILYVIAFALVVVCTFYVVRELVMLCTGRTKEDATKLIQDFISPKNEYHLSSDEMLITEIWMAVKAVIGDVRYEELCRLSRTSNLMNMGSVSGLLYIVVTVNYEDENEKQRIENILKNLVSRYLRIHGLSENVLVNWVDNEHIKMPALLIRYAETEKQLKVLKAYLQEESRKIIEKYQPLKEDEI